MMCEFPAEDVIAGAKEKTLYEKRLLHGCPIDCSYGDYDLASPWEIELECCTCSMGMAHQLKHL